MSITHPSGRRDLRIEGQFLPESVEDLIDLRERVVDLIAAGDCDEAHPKFAHSVADGITGWLVAKSAGHAETVSGPTRSRYRRILAQLDAEAPTGGDGQRGSAGLHLVGRHALATSVAGFAMASGRPALMALAPIIYEERYVAAEAA